MQILLLLVLAIGKAKPDLRSRYTFDKWESKTSRPYPPFDKENYVQHEFKSNQFNYDAPKSVSTDSCHPLDIPDCFNQQFGICIEDHDYPEDELLVSV